MEKLIKSAGDQYERRGHDEYYTLKRRRGRTLLFINSEWTKVLICNRKFQILHEILHYGEGLAIVS